MTGVDFNGHVSEGNSDKEILGRYGLRQMVMDFAKKGCSEHVLQQEGGAQVT